MKKCIKVPALVLSGTAGLVGVLFSIYYFNLDMKLVARVVDPILQKHYDAMERKQYV